FQIGRIGCDAAQSERSTSQQGTYTVCHFERAALCRNSRAMASPFVQRRCSEHLTREKGGLARSVASRLEAKRRLYNMSVCYQCGYMLRCCFSAPDSPWRKRLSTW